MKTRFLLVAICYLLFAFVAQPPPAVAQTSQTATDYIAKRVQFALLDPPQPVPVASVFVSGNPGPAAYYYWIITHTAAGASSPAGPFTISNGPNTLSVSNFNEVNWTTVSDATSYDVLRTANTGPPFGACNCAVATGVTGNTVSDQSPTLGAYTVNTLDLATATVTAQNVDGALAFVGKISVSGAFTATKCKNIGTIRCVDPTNSAGWAGTDLGGWINSAIADLGSTGGTILVEQGVYTYTTGISANSLRNIVLKGVGGQTPGSAAPTELIWTGTGRAVDFRSCMSCRLSNLQIMYNNAALVGPVVDFTHGTAATDTAWAEVDHCSFFGLGVNAPIIVNLDKVTDSTIQDNTFQNYVVAIQGAADNTSYSNAIKVDHNNFSSSTGTAVTANIENPSEGWKVSNNTFEMGNGAGTPNIVKLTTSAVMDGFDFDSNWVGDHNIAVAYTHFDLSAGFVGGFSAHGNFWAGTATSTAISLPNSSSCYVDFRGNAIGPFQQLFSLAGTNCKIDMGTANIPIGSVSAYFATNQPGLGYGVTAGGQIEMWSQGGMLLRSMSDAQMNVKIIPGNAADQKSTIQFTDRNGAMQWQWVKDPTNGAEFQDSGTNNRLQFTTAETSINGPSNSPNGIIIGDTANAGTGGVVFCSGGPSPICHVADITSAGLVKGTSFGTETNCSSFGGTCSAATAGAVTIAAAATTVTVSTTAVTANSDIQVSEVPAYGARLGVTCNTTTGRTYTVTTITAGTSFVITASAAPVTNPACLSYYIIN